MSNNEVERLVDQICEQGCDAVRSVIRNLEARSPLPETARLDPSAQAALLRELKDIMQVYDNPPRP